MQKVTKYTIFETKWGYFGLAGNENGLLRTCLPNNNPEKIKSRLLTISQAPRFEKQLFNTVQEQIIAYFACPACPEYNRRERSRRKGACVNFSFDIPIILDGLSIFHRSVLTTCRSIKSGEIITYSALAQKIGRPGAARAVGNALAQNPLPLIIPCHRVIRSDGKIGGFSAAGGTKTKIKLLRYEQQITGNNKK